MPDRQVPYGAFNFLVNIPGVVATGDYIAGFSDVSGLSTEQTMAEYRPGNFPENHVRKIPGIHKVSDVTLKRGIVNSTALWTWISNSRRQGVAAKVDVKITLQDEAGTPVQSWQLRGVTPMKYTGPTLAGKGGTDVAMEELVLSVEAMEITVP